MNIDDPTLSAFLDGELPKHEMEAIRQRLSEDEHLSERLAELAAVDRRVANHYSGIDARPLPEKVTQLLAEEKSESNNVLTFPWWRRGQNAGTPSRQRAAIAAGIVFAIGFSMAQFFPGAARDTDWQVVSAGLETAPSGTATQLVNDRQLTPRLTFVNQQGEYCRQFQVRDSDSASENIACRTAEANAENPAWRLVATVELDALPDPTRYQTASGGSLLDGILDQMIAGEAVDAEAEQTLIQQHWQTP